jgi:glutamate-ammonia-ligase adenylyltransferase
LRSDVYAMRRLIAQSKGDEDPWDLKLAAGGLIDIEFLAQYILLRDAHAEPGIASACASTVIERAAERGLLDKEAARLLGSAYHLFTDVMQIQRLTLDPGANPREANEAVKRILSKAGGQPTLSALESAIGELRTEVRKIFECMLSQG